MQDFLIVLSLIGSILGILVAGSSILSNAVRYGKMLQIIDRLTIDVNRLFDSDRGQEDENKKISVALGNIETNIAFIKESFIELKKDFKDHTKGG